MSNKNGCYVNIDGDVLGYVYHGVKGDMSNLREKLDLYLEGYKGYGISRMALKKRRPKPSCAKSATHLLFGASTS